MRGLWLRLVCAFAGHHWFRMWALEYITPFERKQHRTHGWVCGRCAKTVDDINKAR